MSNKKIILVVIPITIIVIVFVLGYTFEPTKQVHYEIGLSGITEQYVVSEELRFSIFLNGYGSPCGDYSAIIKKDNETIEFWNLDGLCPPTSEEIFLDFEFSSSTMKPFKMILTESGSYTVIGEFERGDYDKIQATESFTVIEG